MGRKPTEINPECGKRLKSLIESSDMTATELARRVHCSQQHISRIINGRCPLKPDFAALIAKEFPGTNVAWLLGVSNHQTMTEENLAEFSEWDTEWKRRLMAVRTLAFLAGYKIDIFPSKGDSAKITVETALQSVQEGYKIRKNGQELGTCPLERFNLLALDCQELVEQRIKSYLREVSDNGKHSREKK